MLIKFNEDRKLRCLCFHSFGDCGQVSNRAFLNRQIARFK